jgi:hypothetical protein
LGGGILAVAIAIRGGAAIRAEVARNVRLALYTLSDPAPPRRAKSLEVPLGVALAAAAVAVMFGTGGLHG